MRNAATKTPAKAPKRKRAAEVALVPPASNAESRTADVVLPAEAVVAVLEAGATAPTMALASSCTVKDAASIRQALCTLSDSQDQVVIDASAVERVDTAVVQLLYAFVRDRMGSDRDVCWRAPSIAFLDAARLLGVLDLLKLPRQTAGVSS